MIAVLKSGSLKAPKAITTPPPPEARGVGFVVPSFGEGSVLLQNKDGEHFRLAWSGRAPGSNKAVDRRRPLPPGDYTLVGFWIVRNDDRGVTWFLSGTGKNIARVTVAGGETQNITVDETIHMNCKVRGTREGVDIQVPINWPHHCGLTIYRAGERIPIRFRVTDASGKEQAAGTTKYG